MRGGGARARGVAVGRATSAMACANVTSTGRLQHPPRTFLADEEVIPLGESSMLKTYACAVPSTPAEFEAMWGARPPPTPNPMGPGTTLNRLQGTYGATYKFGHQTSADLGPVADAPVLVQRALAFAREFAERNGIDPKLATVAHCNWYEITATKCAALQQHQDAVPAGTDVDDPIVSVTFLQDGDVDYRYFVVSRDRAGKDKVAALPLQDGDVVVMCGMQQDYFHGVPVVRRADHVGQRRINVTVRFWGNALKAV